MQVLVQWTGRADEENATARHPAYCNESGDSNFVSLHFSAATCCSGRIYVAGYQ